MANHLKSKTSIGIRIGIMGEFYINFRYYGFFFMFFIGIIVGMLQKSINKTHITDFRYGFYFLVYSVLLYALIGQSNAVGSLLANYLLFLLFLLIFNRPLRENYKKINFKQEVMSLKNI